MNSTEAIRGEFAHLVREYVVEGVGDVIHGATFDGRRLVLAASNRLLRLLPGSGRVVDQLETFPDRGGLAYDGRQLWQHSEGHLQHLDSRTGFVVRSISPHVREVTGLECIGDDLLVLHSTGRALARVETLDATAVADVEVNVPLSGLAWVGRELWSSTAGGLCRIDPASGRIVAQFALPAGIDVCDLAGDGEGRVWCVDGRSRLLRAFVPSRTG
jgi:ligand-binding sensor domain-containing protein